MASYQALAGVIQQERSWLHWSLAYPSLRAFDHPRSGVSRGWDLGGSAAGAPENCEQEHSEDGFVASELHHTCQVCAGCD